MIRTVLYSTTAFILLSSSPTLGMVVSGDQLLRWCTDKILSPPDIGTSPPAMQLRRSMEILTNLSSGRAWDTVTDIWKVLWTLMTDIHFAYPKEQLPLSLETL